MECTNPDTCPCQHRKTVHMADGTVSPQSERNALRMIEDELPNKVTMEEAKTGRIQESRPVMQVINPSLMRSVRNKS